MCEPHLFQRKKKETKNPQSQKSPPNTQWSWGKKPANKLGNEEHLPLILSMQKKISCPYFEACICHPPFVTELHCFISTMRTGCNNGLVTISIRKIKIIFSKKLFTEDNLQHQTPTAADLAKNSSRGTDTKFTITKPLLQNRNKGLISHKQKKLDIQVALIMGRILHLL